jgi:endonuclease/exonuclease/phosphatase family metal-dependent hydrolase
MSNHDTRDPREVALRDVMDEMDKLGDNVRFILAGDFNLPWNDKGRNGGMDATEKRLSQLLNTLCEVRSLKPVWEALHPNKKVWTRQVSLNAQSGSSHIDHIIVSQCLLQSKAITRMGILQDERVGLSDHRLLVMEYDLAIALSLEEMPQVHSRPKQIDYKNQLQVNQ